MNAVIASDLHIGSPHFLYQDFERFLGSVSRDCDLILNGDVIDIPNMELEPAHQRILELIRQISDNQKVVWVQGNHENGYTPRGFGNVHFKRLHSIGQRLLIIHGDDFDEIMPRNQAFMKAFKLMHDLRVKLGARPVHVAEYAKKFFEKGARIIGGCCGTTPKHIREIVRAVGGLDKASRSTVSTVKVSPRQPTPQVKSIEPSPLFRPSTAKRKRHETCEDRRGLSRQEHPTATPEGRQASPAAQRQAIQP